MADEALRLGLIDDAAGSMEAAIATVRDLAKQSITNTP
jgi:enoyl-CoA hydratase/carnithine racemase